MSESMTLEQVRDRLRKAADYIDQSIEDDEAECMAEAISIHLAQPAPTTEREAFEKWADESRFGPKFRESMFAAWEARAHIAQHVGPADEFPPLPPCLVQHPQLGPMFDRIQMHSYALKMADSATRALTGENAGWQPIETAPKKGRELILMLTPSRFPQVAYSNTWWTSGFSVECKPTHWMRLEPLPASPTPDKEW